MTSAGTAEEPRQKAKSVKERLAEKKDKAPPEPESHLTFLQRMRGYIDALVFAYLLAMFIRSYVFELFMIPTGSMTPTLIGDRDGAVAMADYDDDGIDDVVYTFRGAQSVQVFLMAEDGTYKDMVYLEGILPGIFNGLLSASKHRTDMIVVNKFAYWFRVPDRGEIAVFKVPDRPPRHPFKPDTPVYIKRVLGRPGEEILINPIQDLEELAPGAKGRIANKWGGIEIHVKPRPFAVDGNEISDGAFSHLVHFPMAEHSRYGFPSPLDSPNHLTISDDAVLMIGDNATSSSDGRYWGEVPLDLLRGQAILRYYPFPAASFLH